MVTLMSPEAGPPSLSTLTVVVRVSVLAPSVYLATAQSLTSMPAAKPLALSVVTVRVTVTSPSLLVSTFTEPVAPVLVTLKVRSAPTLTLAGTAGLTVTELTGLVGSTVGGVVPPSSDS